MAKKEISQSLDASTVIDAPFSGSLTDLAPTSGSSALTTPKMPSASGSTAPSSLSTRDSQPRRALTNEPFAVELEPGARVGDYEIEGKIGEGAMGTVYRAVHPAIGKHVAIKVMNAQLSTDYGAIERFTREAKSVAAIQHPSIVDVFGFGTLEDGRAYLVMEWLDGRSLGTRLQRGRVDFDEALSIIDQIARALEAAHDKGITHRDLKPDNVFLQHVAREKPIVKLLDFGLAKLANEEGRLSKTQSGQLLGTPLYMSPEQCKAKDVDHRTDIYALGCMAYELVCGSVPFNPDNLAELLASHLSEEPPRPSAFWPEIPWQLDRIFFAMLAKNPAHRPTLDQVRQTIATVRGLVSEINEVVVSPVKSRKPLVAVLISIVAAAATFAVIQSRGSVQGAPPAMTGVVPDEPTTMSVSSTALITIDAGIQPSPDAAVVNRKPIKPIKPPRFIKPPARKDDHVPPPANESGSGSASRFNRAD